MITDVSTDHPPQADLPARRVEVRPPVVAYGGLAWTLIRTDFKTRYHGTIGGFVWALLKPLVMFAMLMSVFSFVFAGDRDYRLNLIIGLFLWEAFAEGTKAGLMSLDARGFLLTKARCPGVDPGRHVHLQRGRHACGVRGDHSGVPDRRAGGRPLPARTVVPRPMSWR